MQDIFASCICRSWSKDNTGILGILVALDAVSDCFFSFIGTIPGDGRRCPPYSVVRFDRESKV